MSDLAAMARDLAPLVLKNALVTGEFDPTYFGSSTAGTTTYTNQDGHYTRVGNLCYIWIRVTWTGATGTGNGQVGALPFTSASDSRHVLQVMSQNYSYTNAGLRAYIGPSVDYIQLFDQVTGAYSAAAIDTAAELIISGAYRIAS